MDVRMPGVDGMTALERLKQGHPHLPVIMLTAYGQVPDAVQAMKLGAADYLLKPFHNEQVLLAIRRALERVALVDEIRGLRAQLASAAGLGEVMGTSQEIQKVFVQVQQVARTNFTVILQGETGTGKELVARAIHQQSDRRGKPFLAVDCGAGPETLIESQLFGHERGAFTGADARREGDFELASGGTLFLDEVTNLPLGTQAKLLRVLQEHQIRRVGGRQFISVDPRILAASNVDLQAEAQGGRFRQDLFHRLNEFTIVIPPLRERRQDILILARVFLESGTDGTEKTHPRNLGGGRKAPPGACMARQCPGAQERHPPGRSPVRPHDRAGTSGYPRRRGAPADIRGLPGRRRRPRSLPQEDHPGRGGRRRAPGGRAGPTPDQREPKGGRAPPPHRRENAPDQDPKPGNPIPGTGSRYRELIPAFPLVPLLAR